MRLSASQHLQNIQDTAEQFPVHGQAGCVPSNNETGFLKSACTRGGEKSNRNPFQSTCATQAGYKEQRWWPIMTHAFFRIIAGHMVKESHAHTGLSDGRCDRICDSSAHGECVWRDSEHASGQLCLLRFLGCMLCSARL